MVPSGCVSVAVKTKGRESAGVERRRRRRSHVDTALIICIEMSSNLIRVIVAGEAHYVVDSELLERS